MGAFYFTKGNGTHSPEKQWIVLQLPGHVSKEVDQAKCPLGIP